MKYLPLFIQLLGSILIVAGVATYQLPLAVILGGIFCVAFGIASENRGK